MVKTEVIFSFRCLQDKIRLIQEDLETERELRQRVSSNFLYSSNIVYRMNI